jgi:hypothetical protein
MAYASITYTSASGTTFALTNSSGDPIEYIKQNDISVYVNDVLKTLTTHYTFNTAGTAIVLNTAVSGATVLITRTTGIDDNVVTYTPGSTLTAADLNNASNQNLYALQEFRDSYGAFVGGTDLASNTAIIASTETWVSDDSHWATTAAADARTDSKVAANNSVVQGYATAAASSASAASTSASNAATSASNAATSASNAVTAQTAAEAARDQTLAAYDSFDDRYLGTKTSDPTLDNDGNALVAGALYFNSVAGEMRLWTGTTWVAAYVSGAGFLALTGGTMTGALGVTAGTAGSPSIFVSGDTNTGIYSPGADQVAISTAGSGKLFVDANGNVGVGSSAPQKKLHVVGDSNDGIATGASALRVYSADGSAYFSSQYDGIDATTPNPAVAKLVLSVNSTERVRIDNNGRVGIGTASPQYLLDASGSASIGIRYKGTSSYGYIAADNSNTTGGGVFIAQQNGSTKAYFGVSGGIEGNTTSDAGVFAETGGGVRFYTNGSSTAKAVLTSGGSLGIGTASPSGKLTVSGNAIGTTVALTDAATVATDLSLANYYTLTLGGNRTLGAPTNQTAGQSGVIVITQDGTGSRTLAYNSVWKFPNGTVPTLTTTANAVDVLAYYVESGTRITARLLSDVK